MMMMMIIIILTSLSVTRKKAKRAGCCTVLNATRKNSTVADQSDADVIAISYRKRYQ